MRKKRLAALAAEEAARAARRADEAFMEEAVRQAKKAAAIGDVPIGCVIVKEGRIISRGYNRRNADKTVLSHAEYSHKKSLQKRGRLAAGGLHAVCHAGALSHVRRSHCTGQNSPCCHWIHECEAGCAGSVLNILKEPGFNHQVKVETGILGEECSCLMTDFFKELRRR